MLEALRFIRQALWRSFISSSSGPEGLRRLVDVGVPCVGEQDAPYVQEQSRNAVNAIIVPPSTHVGTLSQGCQLPAHVGVSAQMKPSGVS